MPAFDGSPLTSGNEGEQVSFLHETLKRLAYTIDANEVKATTFGPTTAQALRQFQHAGGLAQSGVVDVATFAALLDADDGDDEHTAGSAP